VETTWSVAPDLHLATKLRVFIEEMQLEDIDISLSTSEELPTQYKIVGDLCLKSHQTSYKRLQNMLKKARMPL
jgi:DNA excision repair protein ERCC-5